MNNKLKNVLYIFYKNRFLIQLKLCNKKYIQIINLLK